MEWRIVEGVRKENREVGWTELEMTRGRTLSCQRELVRFDLCEMKLHVHR
jgi:hypothetical protein